MPRDMGKLIKIDGKSWDEGFHAGEIWNPRPEPRPKNPYQACTVQSFSWLSGWVEGDVKRQGYSYTPPESERISRPKTHAERINKDAGHSGIFDDGTRRTKKKPALDE